MINFKITIQGIDQALDREDMIASVSIPNEFKRLTYNPFLSRFRIEFNKSNILSKEHFASKVDAMMFFNNVEIG